MHCCYCPVKNKFTFYENGQQIHLRYDDPRSPDYYLVDGRKYFSKSCLSKRHGLRKKHFDKLGQPDLIAPNWRYGFSNMYLFLEEKVQIAVPF